MARRKRTSKLRPKVPSRIRRRKRKRAATRSHHHPELIGLGLLALGIFLGTVAYGDWSGGYVGGKVADGLEALVGLAVYALPIVLACIGALMLVRSRLVDVSPFAWDWSSLRINALIVLGEPRRIRRPGIESALACRVDGRPHPRCVHALADYCS
jgi:hypothetical protein